jgi:hypothetical protein
VHGKLHLWVNAAQNGVITGDRKDEVEFAPRLLIAGIKTKAVRHQIGVMQQLTVIVNES